MNVVYLSNPHTERHRDKVNRGQNGATKLVTELTRLAYENKLKYCSYLPYKLEGREDLNISSNPEKDGYFQRCGGGD